MSFEFEGVGGGGVIVEAEGPESGEGIADWTTVASLGTARRQLAAAEAGGLVYAIAGDSEASSFDDAVEEYDPDTDTWSTVASLGTARRQLAAAEAGGLVYAIGGLSDANSGEDAVEEYDPDTDTWSTVASLGTGRRELAAAGADGLVYAIGGQSDANDFEDVVERSIGVAKPVYTAGGDTLVGADDEDAIVENQDTGRRSNPTLARDGETIAWKTDTNARLFRTEET